MAHDNFYGICENKCLVEINHENIPGTVPISNGGTGATTASEALTNLGVTATAAELNYVDGVTSAIQTQLNNKISIKTGYYMGNGEESRTITFNFSPSVAFVFLKNKPFAEYDSNYEYTLCNSAVVAKNGVGATLGISLSSNKLTVSQSTSSSDGRFVNLNKNGYQYFYVIFY